MTLDIRHAATSSTPDDGVSDVGSDEWNAALTAEMATGKILGRATAGTGAVEELGADDVKTLVFGTVTAEAQDFIDGSSETPTGDLNAGAGSPRMYRLTDRVFGGDAASFSGHYNPAGMTGIDAESKALHPWAWRDAEVIWSSLAGAISILGTSQSSNRTNWPYIGSAYPSSIGVAGIAINDVGDSNGQCWAGYFDAVRYASSGFTVAIESTVANMGSNTTLTPYNHLSGGAQAGVNHWIASGCGLDRVSGSGYEDVNSLAAYQVYLTSYTQGSPATWMTATSYSVGDLVYSTTEPPVVYVCIEAHTSGTFTTDRASNKWKSWPAARRGRVVTSGALQEDTAGSSIYIVDEFPERHMTVWRRRDAPKTGAELSAYIYCDNRTAGSGAIGLTFNNSGAQFDWNHNGATSCVVSNTNTGSSSNARIALTADHGTFEIYNTSTAGSALTFLSSPGTGGVYWNFSGSFRFRSFGGTNYAVVSSTGISSVGNVVSTSATGGIGYSTGAGGAVTQATSRTTGVTLNTVCGSITLVSAAGSATPASFTVTNSAVAATDTVIVSQKSGTDKYAVMVTAVADGSFQLTFWDLTGTTTEQPVFSFSVIKAVAA